MDADGEELRNRRLSPTVLSLSVAVPFAFLKGEPQAGLVVAGWW